MTDIEPEDVFELLCEEGIMGIDEITEQLLSGKAVCSECGTPTKEYNKCREEVRKHMTTLMDQGKLASTPDWEYYVPTRFQND